MRREVYSKIRKSSEGECLRRENIVIAQRNNNKNINLHNFYLNRDGSAGCRHPKLTRPLLFRCSPSAMLDWRSCRVRLWRRRSARKEETSNLWRFHWWFIKICVEFLFPRSYTTHSLHISSVPLTDSRGEEYLHAFIEILSHLQYKHFMCMRIRYVWG